MRSMRCRLPKCSLLSAVLLSITAPVALAADSFVDTFDDDDTSCWYGGSSWTDVSVEPTGGNGGGWLRSSVTQSPYYAGIATMKPEVGGDWLIAQVSALQVDVRRVSGTPVGAGFRVREGGDVNGWFYTVTTDNLTDEWTTLVAPIDPSWDDDDAIAAGWAKEGANVPSWQETLASHEQLMFRVFGAANPLEMGYDNFQLTFDGPACTSDLDEDRFVGLSDLLRVLSGWGACDCCIQDINRDRVTDFGDLVILLANWGPCWVE